MRSESFSVVDDLPDLQLNDFVDFDSARLPGLEFDEFLDFSRLTTAPFGLGPEELIGTLW